MMAQCTAHAQLMSVYRVTCNRELDSPIFMSKVKGPGVNYRLVGEALTVDFAELCNKVSLKQLRR